MDFLYMFLMLTGLLSLRFLSMCPSSTFLDVNGNCIDCPPGFIDPNCSAICPNGTYGDRCKHYCTCAGCDPVSGCLSSSTDASETTNSDNGTTGTNDNRHPGTNDNQMVTYIVSSSLGFLLLTTMVCCFYTRKRYFTKKDGGGEPNAPDAGAENVSTGRSDNPTYDYAGNVEDPYSFSNGSEYNTLQFAGLRRYHGANIASASIYGVGQFGSDVPENGAYDLGLTLRTEDEMRHKVTEGETNSPSEMEIHGNDDDNPYMNFGGSETSPYELAHNVS